MLRPRLIKTEEFLWCRDWDSSRVDIFLDVETKIHRDCDICWMSRLRPVKTGQNMSISRIQCCSCFSLPYIQSHFCVNSFDLDALPLDGTDGIKLEEEVLIILNLLKTHCVNHLSRFRYNKFLDPNSCSKIYSVHFFLLGNKAKYNSILYMKLWTLKGKHILKYTFCGV